MTSIQTITIEAADVEAARTFYDTAFGLAHDVLQVRGASTPTSGFRGNTLSIIVAQPADADLYLDAAIQAGATALKPAAKSMWGYGGVVQAPDGTIWKVATSSKKDIRPARREYDDLVLLLGVADLKASKRFYVEQGLTVGKSFGSMYAEFETGDGPVKLALYRRKALAKDAGVSPDGSGSHRIVIGGTSRIGADPDGFAWEQASVTRRDANPSASEGGR